MDFFDSKINSEIGIVMKKNKFVAKKRKNEREKYFIAIRYPIELIKLETT